MHLVLAVLIAVSLTLASAFAPAASELCGGAKGAVKTDADKSQCRCGCGGQAPCCRAKPASPRPAPKDREAPVEEPVRLPELAPAAATGGAAASARPAAGGTGRAAANAAPGFSASAGALRRHLQLAILID